MGYMGFGMRKEVYTRKPKKLFSAYKEVYGDHIESVGAKKPYASSSAELSWERHPYRPFDENRWYRLIKGTVTLGPVIFLVGAILYNLLF